MAKSEEYLGAKYVILVDPTTGNPVGSGPTVKPVSPAYTHEPGANLAAVVTIAAPGVGRRIVVSSVEWSYDAAPTAGSLTITDGGTQVFKVDVTSGGPGFFHWDPPKQFSLNAAVVFTLAAGGDGVSGIVNCHAWTE